MTPPEYHAQTGRGDSVFSKRLVLVWAAVGFAVAAAAMVFMDMPLGDERDALIEYAIITAIGGVGGFVTGYRDTKAQSIRNLIALVLGGAVGVAVVILVYQVRIEGISLEAFTLVFLLPTLLGTVALVGAVSGYLGLRLGRLLGGRSTSK